MCDNKRKNKTRNESIVLIFVRKIYSILIMSFIDWHLIPIILSIALSILFYKVNIELLQSSYFEILNSISILSSIFFFGLEKIKLSNLKKDFKSKKYKRRDYEYDYGEILLNSYFSLIFVQILLIGVQYLLLIFSIYNVLSIILILLSIFYLVIGVIVTIGLWYGYEISDF